MMGRRGRWQGNRAEGGRGVGLRSLEEVKVRFRSMVRVRVRDGVRACSVRVRRSG